MAGITPITGIGTGGSGGGGGGGVTSVGGTAPVVSSGGTTPSISIPAATTSNAGHMTAAQATKLAGITGTNTGDQTSIVGITGTKAQFDTAVTDGNFLYVGDINQYTDEQAQDAVGAMVDATLVYTDGTPVLSRAALTGEATASAGSNAVTLTNSAVIGKVLTGYTSGAGTVAATDTILQAIQKLNGNDAATLTAAQSYADGLVTGLLDLKTGVDTSGNPNYPSALKGDAYYVTVAGKIGGASGVSVEVGDLYVASADNAGGTQASVGASWFVLEHNLVGAMVGSNNLSEVTNTATARTNIGLGNVDNTSDANKPVSIAGMAAHSTGVKTGGVLSIGTGGAGVATTFTIASGVGTVVDNTTTPATLVNVSWSAKTDVAVTNIGSQPLTFVAIDSSGNVIQQATDFTGAAHRQYIVIGTVIHTTLTTVLAVNQGHHLATSPQSHLSDLMQSIAGFNISGNLFSANGSNLNLNKSSGEIFKQGANYLVSASNPNIVATSGLTALSFTYNNQTGSASALTTSVSPSTYDLAGVTTAVPTNKFTVQRIYLFSSNAVTIQRGQTLYNSLAEAKAGIQTESFVVNNSISPNGVLRGFLVVKQGTTALNSATDAFFLEAPKFGGTAGVGGLSVSTLQDAYTNSITPEIVTNSTNGAVTFKRGSAADTDVVFEVATGAGVLTHCVSGNGFTQIGNTAAVGSLDVSAVTFNPGTVAVTGTTVTGTSTQFTRTFKAGDSITTTTSSGSETKEIIAVTSDTAMTTASAFAGTNSGVAYTSSNTGSQFVVLPNGNIRAFGSAGSTTAAVNDWINKSNTVNITGNQQIAAFRDQTTINQTVGATGNVNTFVCLTQLNATGTGSFGAVRGFNSAPTVLSTNTGNITTIAPLLSATQIQSGATGTITNQIGVLINPSNASSTNVVTNHYGIQIAPTQNAGTLTSYSGVAIAAKPTAATNSSLLLLGTTVIPSGNYGIYNSSTNDNYLAGKVTCTASYVAHSATAIPAGGTAGAGVMVSSTANFGVFFGSGVPTLSAAQGSLYMRSDGSSTSTRMYVNTNGSTGWTAVTTAT